MLTATRDQSRKGLLQAGTLAILKPTESQELTRHFQEHFGAFGARSNAYDNSGNITANGPGTSYTFDQQNRMLTAGTTLYKYDAQGRRVRKTVGSTVTDYFYLGAEVIAEKQGSTWTDYIFYAGKRTAK
jgi:hypothetical protein